MKGLGNRLRSLRESTMCTCYFCRIANKASVTTLTKFDIYSCDIPKPFLYRICL